MLTPHVGGSDVVGASYTASASKKSVFKRSLPDPPDLGEYQILTQPARPHCLSQLSHLLLWEHHLEAVVVLLDVAGAELLFDL